MFMAYVFHWKKSIWILWRHAKIVTSILNDTGVSCSFNIFRPGWSVLPSSLFCQRNIISIYWPPPLILTISYPPDPPPLPSPITQTLHLNHLLSPRTSSLPSCILEIYQATNDPATCDPAASDPVDTWSSCHLIQSSFDPLIKKN